MRTADLVIAGGGIIGLSAAMELACAGLHTIVIERGRAMSESSWAAAGMLAAHDPLNPPALGRLSELSRSLYPEFLERVQSLTGQSIPLRTRETLQGFRAGEGFSNQESLGSVVDAAAVPGLNSRGRQFLLLEEDSVDPRDLCLALPPAVVACGVGLEQNTTALAVKQEGASVVVETTRGEIAAGAFLNCCGAWAASLTGTTRETALHGSRLEAHMQPGIEPRKGQMVALQLPQSKSVQHDNLKLVLRTPEIYLVPRGDGRIVVGATIERAGFDKAVNDTVIRKLVDDACDLWPPLRTARIVDAWAGLRPGSADGLPWIGRCEDHQWIASGHFRNGILLAPATARVLRQLLMGDPLEIAIERFDPHRFALHQG